MEEINPSAKGKQFTPAETRKRNIIRAAIALCALIWASDFVYKTVNDISYVNRDKCVLAKNLPKPAFIMFEYFIETIVIVFVGTFLAVLLGRWFMKFRKYFPGNPASAFVYASAIPMCGCGVIPLLSSMEGRMKFQTVMSFVLSASLLSPYVIMLSFSVLGWRYGLLRIASSFALVMSVVFILGLFRREVTDPGTVLTTAGCATTCPQQEGDVYLDTFRIFKGLFPYLLVGGALGVLLEMFGPRFFLLNQQTGKGFWGPLVWVLIGVPLYFCNGAEVLFLRPLTNHGFPLGTTVAFSLTSTVICITSIAMLLKVIGQRLTRILVLSVVAISLALAYLINSIS